MTAGSQPVTERPPIRRPEPGSYDRDTVLVGGTWRPARSDERLVVQDSGTEEILGTIRSGSVEDVDVAVAGRPRSAARMGRDATRRAGRPVAGRWRAPWRTGPTS